MEDEDKSGKVQMPEVPLIPAAAIGFLLYPWAVQLVLANPPANDPGLKPAPG
ncbi:MAG TPA: hypothetical protein VGN83_13395 [Falsiroseomonas sp.]|jgi:hypothetical protein|nr:hypothetical protein [Falsiroseomonas sp.]